jgi:hypothetical protein
VALSASGFILGPFVYLGHEMAWDHYTPPLEHIAELPALAPPDMMPALPRRTGDDTHRGLLKRYEFSLNRFGIPKSACF